MTRIVDGLEQLGLAVRSPHPDSARSVRISATAEGEALMRTARRRRIDALVEALGQLSAAERERVVGAAPLLGRLVDALPR